MSGGNTRGGLVPCGTGNCRLIGGLALAISAYDSPERVRWRKPAMKTFPRVETVAVLSVSPIEADHAFLEGALSDSRETLCPDSKWTFYRRGTPASSLPI